MHMLGTISTAMVSVVFDKLMKGQLLTLKRKMSEWCGGNECQIYKTHVVQCFYSDNVWTMLRS